MKLNFQVGPFSLVGLVADGEIESAKPLLDCKTHQFAKVNAPGPKRRNRALLVAAKDVVIAAPERQAEICCGPDWTDFEPADVTKLRLIKRKVRKELPSARPQKKVGDASALECPGFLLEELLDGALRIFGSVRTDKVDSAVAREPF